jgi:hypothetical protein
MLPERWRHHGRAAPRAEELRIETDAEAAAPVIELQLLDIARRPLGAGIVDQDIEAAEIAQGIVEPAVDRGLVGHVEGRPGDLGMRFRHRAQRMLVDIADMHPGTAIGEGLRDGEANARAPGRDHDSLRHSNPPG